MQSSSAFSFRVNETISAVGPHHSSASLSQVGAAASLLSDEGASLGARRDERRVFPCDTLMFFDVDKKTHTETGIIRVWEGFQSRDVRGSCQLAPCLICLQRKVCCVDVQRRSQGALADVQRENILLEMWRGCYEWRASLEGCWGVLDYVKQEAETEAGSHGGHKANDRQQ